jgi:NAD(P)-dependent dehydrogenase (short-subunit alcohol dehydrogenase family)
LNFFGFSRADCSLLSAYIYSQKTITNMAGLKDKVILITGGSKGIGYGVAEALINEGAKVAITSRSKKTALETADRLSKLQKGEVLGVEADVRDPDAQQNAINAVIEKWGSLDVLIANAGLGYFGNIETLTLEQWKETIDTNLSGVFYSIKAALPALKKSKGYIITMASLAGTNFFAGGSAYNASKFGLVGFSQAAMLDLRGLGIKVTTIMPGSVATEFNGAHPDSKDSWKIQPEDIGQIVVDLLKMHPRTLPSKIEVRPSIPK